MEKDLYNLKNSPKNKITIKFKDNLNTSDERSSSSNSSFKSFDLDEFDIKNFKLNDTYTQKHSDRVSKYAVLIGKHMGLSDKEIEDLKFGGLFHDLGKSEIPDMIINKQSGLTDDEYAKMKNHPSIGAHILSNSANFKDIIPIVEYHHEKYDGTGYPYGLKGNDIPYLARITAIADAFDAMTSNRSYRDSLPIETVISEFTRCKGTQFDPEVTEVFLDILKNNFDEIKQIQEDFA